MNRTDRGFRAGRPFFIRALTGLPRPRVTVLGTEFAGEVEATGPSVTSFQVGDRVFGFKGLPFGAHAQYLTIPEDGFLATMPARLRFEEAAPSTEGSHYALALIRKAKVGSGQDVLVNGATGAIGSAAVQLLKQLGAQVTATCGTEHLDLVKSLGADRVIDYTAQDFTTDTQRYDVVLDAVGKSSFLPVPPAVEAARGVSVVGVRPPGPEPGSGARCPAAWRQEGPVEHRQGRPADGQLSQGGAGVAPAKAAGSSPRGVPAREVEEFLHQHPAVSDVQVVGVPDARYGEELRAWCQGRIATFKIPRYWRFVDEFPMTVTGKVQNFKMRETSTAELGLEEVAGTRTA